LWRGTVSCRPENLRARTALASGLIGVERYGEAFREATDLQEQVETNRKRVRQQHAAATDPVFHAPSAHEQAGCALLGVGHPGEAAAHLRRSLALRPGKAHVYCNLGSVLAADLKYEDAAREFHAALAADSDYRKARMELASVQAKMGLYGAVLETAAAGGPRTGG
jgi:Flp pilus assembly protein TadD